MLNDHSPRLRAQQQQALENAAMDEMEKRAAPLLMAVLIVVLAVTVSALANSVGTAVRHYSELVAVNEAMVTCMNGVTISLGDGELMCEVRQYKKLVSGLAAAGGQL